MRIESVQKDQSGSSATVYTRYITGPSEATDPAGLNLPCYFTAR